MTWVTARDLAGLPGMPSAERSVRRLAFREGWPQSWEAVRGGHLVRYRVDALAPEARIALAVRRADGGDAPARPLGLVAAAAGHEIEALRKANDRAIGTAATAAVTGERARVRDDKLRVLVCFRRFWDGFGGQLCPALEAFAAAWNRGEIDAPQSTRERWPRMRRWQTLRDWWIGLERNGGSGITRPPSHRLGKSAVLEGALGQFVLAMLHEMPHLGGTQIHRQARKAIAAGLLRIDGELPAERTFIHAIGGWKQRNQQLHTSLVSPDKWRRHYKSAAGSYADYAQAPNARWEMDGTPTDVLLADGRRWSITGLIDVYTRRMRLRLSASPRAAVVMSLVRETIAEWGLPEVLKTDNGSDYTAEQFRLACEQISPGMHQLCTPFDPNQKPYIERALGTLLHDLFELLPGFVGHDVAQRKDIEARRSFAERLMRGGAEGGPIELRLQPEQLQAILENWLSDYHAREHDGLRGKTPDQMLAEWSGTVFRVDERALDIFLAPASQSGIRTVGKRGIKLDHGFYNCAELGGLEGQQVQVKQDEADLGRCYVFDLAGHYVGTALDHTRLGVSHAEVAAERREHQKRVLAEQREAIKAAVRQVKPQQLVMQILERKTQSAIEQADNVTRIRREAPHTNDAIASVTAAPPERSVPQLSAAAQQTLQRMEAGDTPTRAAVVRMDNPNARYSAWLRLQQRMQVGEAVEPRDLKWADGYAATAECRAMQRLHQGTDPLAAEAVG